MAAAQADAAAQNSKLDAWKAAFSAGDAESVESFVRRVLDASRYPDGFPRQYQVAYRPENRDVIVEFEFPSRQAIPPVRGYRYIKARDSIDPLPRPENEIKQRYARLIACIALRALHEIFAATPGEVVEAVMFNGRVSTIDRATGKPARPHLLSVSADRANFTDLVLASVEPAACLRRLNALVSPNPFDMEAVEPFITFDLKRFRVMADHNATTGVLVTTSWFGRASEEFASRNRITLVNGAELKHLVKEHLNIDVIPGTSPPRRLRASDNAQTGRPGPTQAHRS